MDYRIVKEQKYNIIKNGEGFNFFVIFIDFKA